jgi:Pyruvate/2-oxoacid:ferredoxin oxidoreductase delta subunit
MAAEGDWLAGAVERRAGKRADGSAKPSRIIPIDRALEASQKVMPGEEVLRILSRARTIAVQSCECRENLGRCDAPVDVCIVVDSTAESQLKAGAARRIDVAEARSTLAKTEEAGLIHLIINTGEGEPEAICSCCKCCCQELRALVEFGHLDAVLQSDFVVVKDAEKCIDCGICVKKCVFNAHVMAGERVEFAPARCFGCGLCIRECPSQALQLVKRRTDH